MGVQIGVWLDTEKAVLVRLKSSEVTVQEIDSGIETRVRIEGEKKSYSRLGGSWFNPQKKRTKRITQQLKEFYRKIIRACADADEVFIMGPASAPKGLYKSWMRTKSYKGKLYPVQSAQKMTRNQLIARVKKFFQEINQD